MATAIAIVGESGTGKSTSILPNKNLGIEGLDPQKTVIINVANKPLPTKGWRTMIPEKNIITVKRASEIIDVINKIGKSQTIENIVLDDAQFIMAFEYFDRAKENGFGKFTDIAQNIYKVIKEVNEIQRPINVFFLWHPETTERGTFKMKTVGKLVDNSLTLEGLFSIVLYTDVEATETGRKYRFVTNHDGRYPAKSPFGMFDELYIQNDLGFVAKSVKAFDQGE